MIIPGFGIKERVRDPGIPGFGIPGLETLVPSLKIKKTSPEKMAVSNVLPL